MVVGETGCYHTAETPTNESQINPGKYGRINVQEISLTCKRLICPCPWAYIQDQRWLKSRVHPCNPIPSLCYCYCKSIPNNMPVDRENNKTLGRVDHNHRRSTYKNVSPVVSVSSRLQSLRCKSNSDRSILSQNRCLDQN